MKENIRAKLLGLCRRLEELDAMQHLMQQTT